MKTSLRLIRTALVAAALGLGALLAYRKAAHDESPALALRELAGRLSGSPVASADSVARESVFRPAAPEIRVLFLGNSLTHTAGMPHTLEQLAWAAGVNLTAVQHAPGGWFLSQHVTAPEVDRHLSAGGWTAVVLQEQSGLPAAPERDIDERMFPAARALATRARRSNLEVSLFVYETFAASEGDTALARFAGHEVGTYPGMQARINATYDRLATDLRATIAPVGHAWARVREAQPERNLYADRTHPNEAGGYLIACVFFASLTGRSPAGNPFHGTLDAESAEYLQEIAARTVLRNNWVRGR